LLTFCPFESLPMAVRRGPSGGRSALDTFPAAWLFGAPAYGEVGRTVAMGAQIPLLHSIERTRGPSWHSSAAVRLANGLGRDGR